MKKPLMFLSTFVICFLLYLDSPAQLIAAGAAHSVFTCTNNIAFSCGFNNAGQLGDGTNTNTNIPIQVVGLNGVIDISGGYHSLFLKNDGTVWSCGYNVNGQLGDGTTTNKSVPIQISTLNGMTAVSVGKVHFSLFLKSDSTAWACGNNGSGQLGNGTADGNAHSVPTQVNGLTKITKISAGGVHCLFLKKDSAVWACGGNGYGVLGDGTIIQRTTPVQVSGLSKIIAIAAGNGHSLFLKNNGTVWSCGYNTNGQLGNGSSDNNPHATATQISTLNGIVAIAGGDTHSLFLKNNGTVWACGWNAYGQLGDGTNVDRSIPIEVNGLNNIVAMAGGLGHSIFLKNDGSVWACGWNANGQLGDGTNTIRFTPVQTTPLCGITVGIQENFNENNISVYPNPVSNKLFFKLKELDLKNTKLTISNQLGQILLQSDYKQEVDLSFLSTGIYYIKVQSNAEQKTFKIIKE